MLSCFATPSLSSASFAGCSTLSTDVKCLFIAVLSTTKRPLVSPRPLELSITNHTQKCSSRSQTAYAPRTSMFPLVIAAFPWLVLVLVAYLLLTEPPRELDSTSWRSSFLFLIFRVLLRACVRRQGVLSPGWAVEGGKVKMDENAKRTLSAVWRGWK